MDNIKEIIEKLRDDEHYYGDFGRQFRSNSDISVLLSNPLAFGVPTTKTPALLTGGYFHTAILEPDKLDRIKVIDATTRNTNKYKELSEGELTLLQHEVDKIELLTETILNNEVVHSLIREGNVEYEVPAIGQILSDMYWKGKADIINHDDRLIIDLKTTGNIQQFASSARKYNYDSQAYIYQKLFGYEMVFIAIDKNTHQIGIFDCSNEFLERGATKVLEAEEQYRLFFENEDFDPKNYFLTKTL
jgi:hypothetical protein